MIENLVFSGGGVKCITYVGVLKYLEEHNILKNIKNISATSGGAIFALVAVLGYSYEDLCSLIIGLNFDDLRDISSENIFQFFNNFGIDTGNKLELLVKLLIKKKFKRDDITFTDLYNKFKINLTITGTCLDTKTTEYFNYLNTPEMKVSQAIRISFSIPIVYNRVTYNEKTYIDGGILNNYPIELFNNDIDKTLGFYITGDTRETSIQSIDAYMLNILIALARKIETQVVNKYITKTIKVTCSFNTIDFNLSSTQKQEAINIGYKLTKNYFDTVININKNDNTQKIEENNSENINIIEKECQEDKNLSININLEENDSENINNNTSIVNNVSENINIIDEILENKDIKNKTNISLDDFIK